MVYNSNPYTNPIYTGRPVLKLGHSVVPCTGIVQSVVVTLYLSFEKSHNWFVFINISFRFQRDIKSTVTDVLPKCGFVSELIMKPC